jgi:hypothetical protein
VDAAAPAALMRSQGGPRPVSDRRRGRRTALKRTAKPCGPGARGWRQVGGGVAGPTGRANAVNSPMTEARGIRLRGERGISRKTTAQGMPECSDCTCMLVCATLRTYCTRDRGCSKHPAFPAPSSLWAKRVARPGRNASRECGGVCRCRKDFAGRISMHPAGCRRNAAGDVGAIVGRAPGRHPEECRQHQGRHDQDHTGKLAHASAPQPALDVQRSSTVRRVGKCSGADLTGVLPRLGAMKRLTGTRTHPQLSSSAKAGDPVFQRPR